MSDLNDLPDIDDEAPKKRGRKPKADAIEAEAFEAVEVIEPNLAPAEKPAPSMSEKAAYIAKANEVVALVNGAIISHDDHELVVLGQAGGRAAINLDNYATPELAANALQLAGV